MSSVVGSRVTAQCRFGRRIFCTYLRYIGTLVRSVGRNTIFGRHAFLGGRVHNLRRRDRCCQTLARINSPSCLWGYIESVTATPLRVKIVYRTGDWSRRRLVMVIDGGGGGGGGGGGSGRYLRSNFRHLDPRPLKQFSAHCNLRFTNTQASPLAGDCQTWMQSVGFCSSLSRRIIP